MNGQHLNLQAALIHLRKDPVMKKLIKRHGPPEWDGKGDLFFDLVKTIVSQQLSDQAATTIFSRFEEMLKDEGIDFSPRGIFDVQDRKIRESGVSFNKIKYLKNLCQAIVSGQLGLDDLPDLTDEEVIAALTQVKGIGPWTAEMTLIFTLNRPDVFSVADLGLRQAVSQLYYVSSLDKQKIEKISLQWKPYRSVACRYLWKSLEEVSR